MAFFQQHKHELMRKALEVSSRFDCEMAIILFTPTGRLVQFASSSMEDILEAYSHARTEPHEIYVKLDAKQTVGDRRGDLPRASASKSAASRKRSKAGDGAPLTPRTEEAFGRIMSEFDSLVDEFAGSGKRSRPWGPSPAVAKGEVPSECGVTAGVLPKAHPDVPLPLKAHPTPASSLEARSAASGPPEGRPVASRLPEERTATRNPAEESASATGLPEAHAASSDLLETCDGADVAPCPFGVCADAAASLHETSPVVIAPNPCERYPADNAKEPERAIREIMPRDDPPKKAPIQHSGFEGVGVPTPTLLPVAPMAGLSSASIPAARKT